MISQKTDNRVRPGFAVLLALAAVSIAVWLSVSKPKIADKANVQSVTAQKPTAAKRSSHAKPKSDTNPAPSAQVAVVEHPLSASAQEPAVPIPAPQGGTPSLFEAQWGIRISDVVRTDIDSVLEMRYMVVDPSKIAALADGENMPCLIEQTSGAQVMLCVPLHEKWPYAGHSRARSMAHISNGAGGFPPAAGKAVAGRTYSLLIPNPDLAVKKGSRVVVAVGDIRSDSLVVE